MLGLAGSRACRRDEGQRLRRSLCWRHPKDNALMKDETSHLSPVPCPAEPRAGPGLVPRDRRAAGVGCGAREGAGTNRSVLSAAE